MQDVEVTLEDIQNAIFLLGRHATKEETDKMAAILARQRLALDEEED